MGTKEKDILEFWSLELFYIYNLFIHVCLYLTYIITYEIYSLFIYSIYVLHIYNVLHVFIYLLCKCIPIYICMYIHSQPRKGGKLRKNKNLLF